VKEIFIGKASFRHWRDLYEQMEVIVHQAISGDSAAAEFLIHPHQSSEFFLLQSAKSVSSLDHAGYDMIEYGLFRRISPPCQPSRTSHVVKVEGNCTT
jgi:hypothetical protein